MPGTIVGYWETTTSKIDKSLVPQSLSPIREQMKQTNEHTMKTAELHSLWSLLLLLRKVATWRRLASTYTVRHSHLFVGWFPSNLPLQRHMLMCINIQTHTYTPSS